MIEYIIPEPKFGTDKHIIDTGYQVLYNFDKNYLYMLLPADKIIQIMKQFDL